MAATVSARERFKNCVFAAFGRREVRWRNVISAVGMERVYPCWELTTKSWVASGFAQSVGRNFTVKTNLWAVGQVQVALAPHADSVRNRPN